MDITTNTIAELYIRQGYPEKAKDIYRAILELDPGNAVAIAKLKSLDAPAEPVVEFDDVPVEFGEMSAGFDGASLETVEAGAIDTSVPAQIARLEKWLEQVQSCRGRA